ncbi:sigma-54-dependent Fis family transcriptional regulator [bacterium]|nr:MAG: sigma-54-dependent Fis family transcriptional regulator [bacterium]
MTKGATILIVDDEPNIRRLLSGVLSDEGYCPESFADTVALRRRVDESGADLVLLDVCLPGESGVDWLADRTGDLPVVMMSGHANIDLALRAVGLGAVDFLEKPIAVERLLLSVSNALERSRLSAENQRLRRATEQELLGESETMHALREAIGRVAPTGATVLITGESGAGKELVARALHRQSGRGSGELVKVNCAAIPAELLESELFGHEKGAFTGADRKRRGRFELADHGTLLLDEIGDMPPALQAKLLRVLEDGMVMPLGAEKATAVDIRLLCSTNVDLAAAVARGEFREDLYHRICVLPLRVPALREHPEDIAGYLDSFLGQFCAEVGREQLTLDEPALALLRAHEFSGNVRELRNLAQRMAILAPGPVIAVSHLAALLGTQTGAVTPRSSLAGELEALERKLIATAVQAAAGNLAEAARQLGVDRANLHRRMKRLGIGRD